MPVTRVATLGAVWRLELIGNPSLQGANQNHKLERKIAGVLAYLALEGETTRSKLAGLLWSDVVESRARANLRQCMHRLKKSLGVEIIQDTDPLKLVLNMQVDAVQLESSSFLGDDGLALITPGELLEGLDFEDQPDFAEWLERSRERLRMISSEALRREINRLEEQQEISAALEQCERWLTREPLLEEAYRTLMRLHVARGDRATALQVFKRCEETLMRELGLEPGFETQTLRKSLEHDVEITQNNTLQKLEQIVVVAGEDFNLTLAGNILNLSPLDLTPLLEKTKTQVQDALATPLLEYLHQQIAYQLEQQNANSGRIAHHWMKALEPEKAVPYLLKFAQTLINEHQNEQAVICFEQAVEADLMTSNQTRAFQTLYQATYLSLDFDLGENTKNRVERLFKLSNSGLQRAQAFLAQAEYQQLLGQNSNAESAARAGIELLKGNKDLAIESALNSSLSSALWAQSKLNEALSVGQYVIELNLQLGLLPELATSHANLATVYQDLQNYPEAILQYEKALAIRCQVSDPLAEAQTRLNLAAVQAQTGFGKSSFAHLELAKDLLEKTDGTTRQMIQCLNEIGQRQLGFAQFDLAITSFQNALNLGKPMNFWAVPNIESNQIFTLITLGAFEQAAIKLEQLLGLNDLRPTQRYGLLRLKIMLNQQTKRESGAVISELEQLKIPEQLILKSYLDRLDNFSSNRQLEICQTLLEIAQRIGLYGNQIIVQTKMAQVLLQTQPLEALKASSKAIELLEQFMPISFYQAQTYFTHYQTLQANNAIEAKTQLQNTVNWVLNVSNLHVPLEYQESFLQENPVNKSIFKAARDYGISSSD